MADEDRDLKYEIARTVTSWENVYRSDRSDPWATAYRDDQLMIIDDPYTTVDVDKAKTLFRDSGSIRRRARRSWGLADAPLAVKILGYSFVAVLSIIGGLALGMLILFLVACCQALLDIVFR